MGVEVHAYCIYAMSRLSIEYIDFIIHVSTQLYANGVILSNTWDQRKGSLIFNPSEFLEVIPQRSPTP